jgi:peptidoglycan hydrolase-like protein with peptidoglycan-binding domain
MARILIALNTPYREVLINDAAVGPACPNQRPDVLVVQYLLRVAGEGQGYSPPGELPIKIDGIYGSQTQKYISFFQKEVNRRQGRKLVEPDGRIDPVRTGTSQSAVTGTFYTVLALNAALRTRRGDQFKFESDGLFPAELRQSLFLVW